MRGQRGAKSNFKETTKRLTQGWYSIRVRLPMRELKECWSSAEMWMSCCFWCTLYQHKQPKFGWSLEKQRSENATQFMHCPRDLHKLWGITYWVPTHSQVVFQRQCFKAMVFLLKDKIKPIVSIIIIIFNISPTLATCQFICMFRLLIESKVIILDQWQQYCIITQFTSSEDEANWFLFISKLYTLYHSWVLLSSTFDRV